jgi:hypothetical protein
MSIAPAMQDKVRAILRAVDGQARAAAQPRKATAGKFANGTSQQMAVVNKAANTSFQPPLGVKS